MKHNLMVNDNPSLVRVDLRKKTGYEQDLLVVEEPLEIRVNSRPIAVVLRTPGRMPTDDLDLVRGFLLTEAIIEDIDDLISIGHCADRNNLNRGNLVFANLGSGSVRQRVEDAQRTQFVTSSCGVCGKASIDKIFNHVEPHPEWFMLDTDRLNDMIRTLRTHQNNFSLTGGIHGAGIFTDDGEMVCAAEDIGRHNAVDKVIGHAIREELLPLNRHILVVSSRAGFEIVQKALMAGIRAVVSVGASSSMAHELAERSRLSLYSFVRDDRFNEHRPKSVTSNASRPALD